MADRILAEVVSRESAGYQFEAADASFDLLVRKCMKQYKPHFETLHYDVKVDNKTGGDEVTAEAIEERAEVAAGLGFLGGPYTWGLLALLVIIVIIILAT